jgi:hypothetical protein
VKVEQREAADFLSSVSAQEIDQTVGGRDIGADRVRAASPVMGKVAPPTRGKRPRRMPFPL